MDMVTFFSLLGGLGLFLLGMKDMSEGLEKAAGARMRGILEFFTKNRFIGMMVGILFTAVVQSSSATTVMVVSFVNSGLMTLLQATGVILGANIGTTVTGQLIAFNLSDIAPLFVIIGVVMVMFCKKVKVKNAGEVILGFGILFLGLSMMGDAIIKITEKPVCRYDGRFCDHCNPAEFICYGWYCYFDGITGTSGIYNLSVFSAGL